MIAATRHGTLPATLLQLSTELTWVFCAGVLAMRLQGHFTVLVDLVVPALVFALLVVMLNTAFGLYRQVERLSSRYYLLRSVLAPTIGMPVAWLLAEYLPGGTRLQENLGSAALLTVGGLLLVRHFLIVPLIDRQAPHRILVLGTGPDARRVEVSLATEYPAWIKLVGFYGLRGPTENAVPPARVIAGGETLVHACRRLQVKEIVVAVREQRGGILPLEALLDCRLDGIQVTDLSRFYERVHGHVPIDSLKSSWLIYGSGYRQGILRAACKRAFDIAASGALAILTAPLMLVVALAITLEGGMPVIYRQRRVGLRGTHFTLLKFRSMATDAEKNGQACWAALNDTRITRVGRLLRRTRIDELPQLFNVLRGEMSLVGPRPERPEFVATLRTATPFYSLRHTVKPGLTGWAQVRYCYGATIEQQIRKLEYDLYYVKNHSLSLDLVILLETIRVVLLGEGAR